MSRRAPAISVEALAEQWRCRPAIVYGLINDGRLPAFRVGSRILRVWPEVAAAHEHLRSEFRSPNRSGCRVYFIQCGEFVKIGTATDVAARLLSLQTANPLPLVLLATERGFVPRERELHRQFAALRHANEWFRYEGELKAYIEGLPK